MKKTTFKIPADRLEYLLMYSFRYALGRKSYAVEDVAITILENLDCLSENTKNAMIDEIELAITVDKAGTNHDKALWQEVAIELHESLYEHIRTK